LRKFSIISYLSIEHSRNRKILARVKAFDLLVCVVVVVVVLLLLLLLLNK
jgi:multisubunit Na+/H+ antiporter MnhB subunit